MNKEEKNFEIIRIHCSEYHSFFVRNVRI